MYWPYQGKERPWEKIVQRLIMSASVIPARETVEMLGYSSVSRCPESNMYSVSKGIPDLSARCDISE